MDYRAVHAGLPLLHRVESHGTNSLLQYAGGRPWFFEKTLALLVLHASYILSYAFSCVAVRKIDMVCTQKEGGYASGRIGAGTVQCKVRVNDSSAVTVSRSAIGLPSRSTF